MEAWQRSGLSQAGYCAEQHIDLRTFTVRLSDYRKLSATVSSALIPVQVEPAPSGAIVFTHAQGHRLELPASVSANWVAELLRCLA
ncbi:IS66 family insertion sequence element accessory protein TnpA [Methylomonas albis]|uniref:IS66 family insertion sequence element accessory protein TnpA n=1 Tax=Methylomonas albis TaxID=1854563 RepID=UPI0038994A94